SAVRCGAARSRFASSMRPRSSAQNEARKCNDFNEGVSAAVGPVAIHKHGGGRPRKTKLENVAISMEAISALRAAWRGALAHGRCRARARLALGDRMLRG